MKYLLILALSFSSVFTAQALRFDPSQMTNNGEIVPYSCEVWNDGCNDCEKTDQGYICPPKTCATMRMGYCRVEKISNEPAISPQIMPRRPTRPPNCQRWFDGCNTCAQQPNGVSSTCTMMACETYDEPRCLDEVKSEKPRQMAEIPANCESWFDGCNTCGVQNGKLTFCTQRECMSNPTTAYCKSYEDEESDDNSTDSGAPGAAPGWDPGAPVLSLPYEPDSSGVPFNCLSWFDGCNTCTVSSGQVGACTRKFCSEKERPYCLKLMESPDPLVLSVPFSGSITPQPISPKPRPPKPNVLPDIPANCESWFDGCNTCGVQNGKLTFCTQRECMSNPTAAYCKSFTKDEVPAHAQPDDQLPAISPGRNSEERVDIPSSGDFYSQDDSPSIPVNCISWYDGCNTCGVENGALTFCTEMACVNSQMGKPYCKAFSPLEVPSNTNLGADINPLSTEPQMQLVQPDKPNFWGFIKYHLFAWFR